MTSQLLFYLLIGLIALDFFFESILNKINALHYNDKIPSVFPDLYNDKEYLKAQNYKVINHKFHFIQSSFYFLLILIFFYLMVLFS